MEVKMASWDLSKKQCLKMKLTPSTITDELIYVEQRLFIFAKNHLEKSLVWLIHKLFLNNHLDGSSTIGCECCEYHWPRINNSVSRFVKSCHTGKRYNNHCEDKKKMLKPLLITDLHWKDKSGDIIRSLSKFL